MSFCFKKMTFPAVLVFFYWEQRKPKMKVKSKQGLCSSLYSSLVAIPVYVKHNINFRDSSSLGRFEITVGPKQTMGKTVEGVMVTSQMPKGVLNMSLTPSQGTHIFDPVTKVREIRFF